MKKMKVILAVVSLLSLMAVASTANADSKPSPTGLIFQQLSKSSEWKPAGTIKLTFDAHHPQGLTKIGNYFFLTSVEVIEKPARFEKPVDGYDRTHGKGIGHFFKFDRKGKTVEKIKLGEDTIYHPGGIDYDGHKIWVPVAEYRPNSRSIIYTIDPDTLEATKIFTVEDHIGGLVYDRKNNTLNGVSWGARKYYTWDSSGKLIKQSYNHNHYIDYQDCKYVEDALMLCAGANRYMLPDQKEFFFGGIDLIDLATDFPIHQIPVNVFTGQGRLITYNTFFYETLKGNLRFYFAPDDIDTTVYIFNVSPTRQ